MRYKYAIPKAKLSIYLTAPSDITCTDANTWYPITGTFGDGDVKDFTYNPSTGELTYTGVPQCVEFNGVSMFSTSKTGVVNYGLFVNNVVQNGCDTPLNAEKKDSIITMTCCKVLRLTTGCTIRVQCKSAIANNVIAVSVLNVLFMGECN